VPRWREFADIRIGSALDEVLGMGAVCHPALESNWSPQAVAAWSFGFSLPHRDADSAALRRALQEATVCHLDVLEQRAHAVVVAFDRRVTGATIYVPLRDSAGMSLDSLRKYLRQVWGSPTAPAPTLDSWLGRSYRAYMMIPRIQVVTGVRAATVILIDVAACTDFDRRVHLAGARGQSEAC